MCKRKNYRCSLLLSKLIFLHYHVLQSHHLFILNSCLKEKEALVAFNLGK